MINCLRSWFIICSNHYSWGFFHSFYNSFFYFTAWNPRKVFLRNIKFIFRFSRWCYYWILTIIFVTWCSAHLVWNFISWPTDKISDEVSTTSGYEYNSQNSIIASSGKSKYKFDIAQEDFAWISSSKIEKRIIKRMKKASRIMVTAYNKSGSQTIDHYSLMGFTKAYNSAKKNCT